VILVYQLDFDDLPMVMGCRVRTVKEKEVGEDIFIQ
jgi:hypothetical protein